VHASAGATDADELTSRQSSVDEHGDRLGDHNVEGVIRKVEGEDVALLDVDAVCCVRSPDRLVRPLEHERFDVDGGHLRAEALRDCDRRCPHATSDVEHVALPGDRRTLQQPFCRGPAPGMDDAFPITAMKTYGSSRSTSAASRRRRCRMDTLTLLSVTEDGCRLVADPLPERRGAPELGVCDEFGIVQLPSAEADRTDE
jgi:hypothetical protein